jgi:methylase of polypeptide subunit release factors
MDKLSAENLVTEAFNFPFNQSKYSELISNIFKSNISSNLETIYIEDNFRTYVNHIKLYNEYRDQNGKKIHAIEIELSDKVSFIRSRYIQRNIAIKYLKKNNCDALLVSFHNKKFEDWRLSLIIHEKSASLDNKGNIKLEIKTSSIKRLSYLLGKNETNFTAKSQILSLIIKEQNNLQDIQYAFSLEKVSDEFFEDYKNLYISLKAELDNILKNDQKIFEDFKNKNIQTYGFAKKLLGQIVFLYFLQKKGWLGIKKNEKGNFQKWGSGSKTFLRDIFNEYKKKILKGDNFFNSILEPIFYLALNNEEEYYEKLECKIPFLNGGLFTPFHDYNWSESNIRINDLIISNIFDVFDRYNFTIEEDQTFDSDVAVDPEMLGKVFERLLPENFRKGKGSFYTPREVVYYMSSECILNYLLSKTNQKFNSEDILNLIDYSIRLDEENDKKFREIFNLNDLNFLDKVLSEIKICDPAIGSGAFSVQIMTQVVNIRSTLLKLQNKEFDNYTLKRNFIENSIYGVDIDSSAIEIAKLRLWLSLVVDEKSYDKIQTLPNLDYKILQGNSLIQQYKHLDFSEKEDNLLFEDEETKNIKQELVNIQKEYIYSSSRKTSKRLREKLNNSIEQLIQKKDKNKNIGQNFFSLNQDRNFFLWNIFFLDAIENGGFDIVIGNPPYVFSRDSKLKGISPEDKKYFYKKYKLIDYKINYYLLFIELGARILKPNGFLGFIIPNNWMTINTNESIRKFVLSKSNVKIVNCTKKVFATPDVDASILFFNNKELLKDKINLLEYDGEFKLLKQIDKSIFQKDSFIINFEIALYKKCFEIFNKIENNSSKLFHFATVRTGIQAYGNNGGIPIQNAEMGKKRVYHSLKKINKDYIKYLDSNDVHRYKLDWSKEYIKYGENLFRRRTLKIFQNKRVLVKQIPSVPPYCINSVVAEETLINDVNTINIAEINNYSPYEIVGILNSKLTTFWFIFKFGKLQRSIFPQFKVGELQQFPIPKKLNSKNNSLTKKLDNLSIEKHKDPNISNIDNEIDKLVYEIFDIKENEILEIENYLLKYL